MNSRDLSKKIGAILLYTLSINWTGKRKCQSVFQVIHCKDHWPKTVYNNDNGLVLTKLVNKKINENRRTVMCFLCIGHERDVFPKGSGCIIIRIMELYIIYIVINVIIREEEERVISWGLSSSQYTRMTNNDTVSQKRKVRRLLLHPCVYKCTSGIMHNWRCGQVRMKRYVDLIIIRYLAGPVIAGPLERVHEFPHRKGNNRKC